MELFVRWNFLSEGTFCQKEHFVRRSLLSEGAFDNKSSGYYAFFIGNDDKEDVLLVSSMYASKNIGLKMF